MGCLNNDLITMKRTIMAENPFALALASALGSVCSRKSYRHNYQRQSIYSAGPDRKDLLSTSGRVLILAFSYTVYLRNSLRNLHANTMPKKYS